MPLPTFVFLIILVVLIMAAAIWLYCIKPGNSFDEARKKAFKQYDYAHRGFYTKDQSIPENSLPAFQRAVSKGFGVELDLQLTADGQVVVFHDDTLQAHVRHRCSDKFPYLEGAAAVFFGAKRRKNPVIFSSSQGDEWKDPHDY